MKSIKKILIYKDKKFYYKDSDLHTQYGLIKKEEIEKSKNKVKSHLKKEFYVFNPSFIDKYEKLRKMPQTMLLKDIAPIIAYTGINKDSMVLDAGTGSAFLACFLANLVKKVITYERRKEFIKNAKENIEFLELKNIKIKNQDIFKKITEKNLDLITLDVTEPWKAIKNCEKALKNGGFLVSYSPSITQVMKFVKELKKANFVVTKIIETIEREWHSEDLKVRPKTKIIGHSGFLVFSRKV
jgi:tRNA (adenine57-N1/adenine58-N1)-methyltransferase